MWLYSHYLIHARVRRLYLLGLSHSEIFGSKRICRSPKLIAAYHVLLRLLAPRHPSCALCSLINLTQTPELSLQCWKVCFFVKDPDFFSPPETLHSAGGRRSPYRKEHSSKPGSAQSCIFFLPLCVDVKEQACALSAADTVGSAVFGGHPVIA